MPINFILTNAGKAAIVAANNTGTNPVTINRVGVGSASWTPTAAATALNTEIKKISAIGGAAVANDTIHVTASDTSSDVYIVKEIGLFLTDGTLLAVYSQSAAIITKGEETVALIAADLVITGLPAGSVTVGDVTFDYPQATESVKGVAEIATTSEAQNGDDDTRIITPKKLQDVTATETRKGVIELATDAEVQTGTDTVRAVTPAGLAARTSTETRRGIIELATSSEAIAGTDTERAVTPAGLSARTATELRRGIIELATSTEVITGTDTERAVTPAGLAARTATTTRAGIIEIATQTEVDAGADTERAVTAQTMRLYPGVSRGWANFDGVGTVDVNNSHGVASVTDYGVGLYRITWDDVFGSANYAWVGTARFGTGSGHVNVSAWTTQTKTVSILEIRTTGESGNAVDPAEISIIAFA
jgi:hypothetical protein